MPDIKPTLCEKMTLPSGRVVEIPKLIFAFQEWKGTPIKNTYNNKPVVDCDGRPFFAEKLREYGRDIEELGIDAD